MFESGGGMHLAAFTQSADTAGAFTDIPAVTDGWAPVTNNHFLLPQDMKLLKAVLLGATATEGRINTPNLRRISLPSITPIHQSATPGDLPAVCDYEGNEPIIDGLDEFAAEWIETAAGAERVIVGVWLGALQRRPAPAGPVYTVRATSSITDGNLLWGRGSFTLQQTLPRGRYAVVGLDIIGANLIFARLRFPDQGPLPGVLARQTVGDIPWQTFRMGRAGLFGEFDSTAPPTLELFGSAAPTTQIIYLDLVKVR